jgi:predicted dehydrogenase
MSDQDDDEYGLSPNKQVSEIPAPNIQYQPPRPKSVEHGIGLIGAGGISEFHLRSYRRCGYRVKAIASRSIADAVKRRDEFFPEADVYDDYRKVLDREDITVIDATPHPTDRLPIIRDAITAGKHVLSQKPFVLDLADGRKLVQLAKRHDVLLAVNQNGRWAPHFSYLRQAIAEGLIGDITTIDFSLQWDQTWIAGTPAFEDIHHLILFDFGVHWFDITNCLMGQQRAESVFAEVKRFDQQVYHPPAIASAIIRYPQTQIRMSFHGHTQLGEEDVTTVVGTQGTLRSRGPGLNDQPHMQVFLESGKCTVPLGGCWFDSGFDGAMGELLCAIEQNRDPNHSAANNLHSLELCFAAVRSADIGHPVPVGTALSVQH